MDNSCCHCNWTVSSWTDHPVDHQIVFNNVGTQSVYSVVSACNVIMCVMVIQDYVEVRQFEKSVRDAEGKLAQVFP